MTQTQGEGGRFKTFKEFYPFYLGEHSNPTCRALHFVGTTGVNLVVIAAVVLGDPKLLLWTPVAGYSFAWIGHFGFEKNRPATFKQPIYSLMGDYLMYWQLLTGKIGFYSKKSGA